MSSAYQGTYTINLFNAEKRYRIGGEAGSSTPGGFVKGVPLADSELRELNLVSDSFLKQLIHNNFPRGSSTNDGFKVKQSDSDTTNNFTIKGGDGTVNGAGVLFVDGYILFLRNDIEFKNQDDTGALTDDDYTETGIPALTTPPGAPPTRIDEVYVDFYFAEASATAGSEYTDTSLAVAGVGTNTANRIRQVQDIRVAEGGLTPVDYTDGNGIFHRLIKIATITRLAADATILTAMIVDNRTLINPVSALGLFNPQEVLIGDGDGSITQVSDFVNDGTNVGIGTTDPQAKLHVFGDIVGKNDDTSNLGSAARKWANLYMASTIHYGANGLDFASGGPTIRVTIDNSGNVGIGSTQPAAMFDVGGNKFSVDSSGNVVIASNLTVNGTTTTLNTETTVADMMQITQDDNQVALLVEQVGIGSTATVVEVKNAGSGHVATFVGIGTGSAYVGIGTTNPASPLHVKSPGATVIKIDAAGSNNPRLQFAQGTADKDYIQYNNANYLEYNANSVHYFNNNVGIGLTNPAAKFHVVGDALIQNSVTPVLGLKRATQGAVLGLANTPGDFGWSSIATGDAVLQASTGNKLFLGTLGGSVSIPTMAFTPTGTRGRVGIGTTVPLAQMHLWHTAFPTVAKSLLIEPSLQSGSSSIQVGTVLGTGVQFIVDNIGAVGINTSAPRDSIDVDPIAGGGILSSYIGSHTGNDFKIKAAGSTIIIIDQATKNVGIGTVPAYQLHVENAGPCTIQTQSDAGSSPAFYLRKGATLMGYLTSTSSEVQVGSAGGSAVNTQIIANGISAITVLNSNQNVGIGTSPAYAFHVERTGSCTIQVQSGAGSSPSYFLRKGATLMGYLTSTSSDVQVGSANASGADTQIIANGSAKITIANATGNVGIGTAPSGSYKLNILGDVLVDGSKLEGKSNDTTELGSLSNRFAALYLASEVNWNSSSHAQPTYDTLDIREDVSGTTASFYRTQFALNRSYIIAARKTGILAAFSGSIDFWIDMGDIPAVSGSSNGGDIEVIVAGQYPGHPAAPPEVAGSMLREGGFWWDSIGFPATPLVVDNTIVTRSDPQLGFMGITLTGIPGSTLLRIRVRNGDASAFDGVCIMKFSTLKNVVVQ